MEERGQVRMRRAFMMVHIRRGSASVTCHKCVSRRELLQCCTLTTMADVAIFKKSKARPSRLRTEAATNDTEEASDVSASLLAAKVRKQQKERIKPKAKLSFGGDEVSSFLRLSVKCARLNVRRGKDADGEVFEVKKKFSKKLNLGSNPSSRSVKRFRYANLPRS